MKVETKRITRGIIYGLALAILASSLWYSNYLARQLETKERRGVQLYADALTFIIDPSHPDSDPGWTFIYEKVFQENDRNVPKILVGEQNQIVDYVLDIDSTWAEARKEALIQDKLREFKLSKDPVPIEFAEGRFNYMYYGDSALLKQLRWFPFLQLLVAFSFIGVVFFGFAVAKRNEQNRVWVGLAKETAHQLGTPVSSLMAWIELLKLRLETQTQDLELVEEMEHDVRRLESIAERFSKIGSQPELQGVSLKEVLDRSAGYLKKRMTQRGSIQLEVDNTLPPESQFMVNPQLFDWVIENLLKNALDAIQSQEGHIRLHAGEKGRHYFIDVEDTGKGIAKSHFKKVFEPGFTTKKRGWGLGLSLSKRIIENYHRGRIFVKQSELGKGTTFRILLPKA